MSMMPRVLSACLLVCLATSQAVPDQESCTTPVDDATKSVNVEGLDSDMTSLMQVKQRVATRGNASHVAKPSTSGAFCVNSNIVTAYEVKFRRYDAIGTNLGCIGEKQTGYFYAGFRCTDQMSLWTNGAPQAILSNGPTTFDQTYASSFSGEVKAAEDAVASGTKLIQTAWPSMPSFGFGSSASSSGTSNLQFLSTAFSSFSGLVETFNANPKALAALKQKGANARLVTEILELSAESKEQIQSAFAGNAMASEASGTGSVSVQGSSSNTVAITMPKGQTLGYEISKPMWGKAGKLVDFKRDEMCDFDDSWMGPICTC